jgi:hypothetical protein
MGQKIGGDMYCDRCRCHVLGVKNTHPARNAAAVLAMPLTGGLSLAGAGVSDYQCPNCGGPVRRATGRDMDEPIYPMSHETAEKTEPEIVSEAPPIRLDGTKDAEAARLIRAQVDKAGETMTKPVRYLFFRFGVARRHPGAYARIENRLADVGLEVSPSLSESTDADAIVTLAVASNEALTAASDGRTGDLAGDLERLSALFRDGLLTEAEFNSAKSHLI